MLGKGISMSTRARIGMMNDDGTITSSYLHSDGYPSYVIPILEEHFCGDFIVNLLGYGDMSILAADIGDRHSFDEYTPGVCRFYRRDRDETNVDAQTHVPDEWPLCDAEYHYLYFENSWICRERIHVNEDEQSFGRWEFQNGEAVDNMVKIPA